MAGPLRIEITETAKYFEKSIKQAKSGSDKERLQMLWWLKTGQVNEHQELSQRLGRAPATISRWLSKYRQGGLSQLREVKTPLGATPKIQGEALEKLQERLLAEQGFGSYGEIGELLAQAYQLQVKYHSVNRFVPEKLNASLKVPRPVSSQQQQTAVETFKKTSVLP